jgi:hypothetical protein
MTDLDLSSETPPPNNEGAAPAAAPPPRRSPGHRGQDVRDTVAELAARAHAISLEAGSKMASALKDVINAASGVSNFAVESARDLVQYFVRRGQMTQEEGDKLLREAEEQSAKRGRLAPPRVEAPKKPLPPLSIGKPAVAPVPPPVAKVAVAPPPKAAPVKPPPPKPAAPPAKAAAPVKPAHAPKAAAAKAPAKPVAKAKASAASKPAKPAKPAKKPAHKK